MDGLSDLEEAVLRAVVVHHPPGSFSDEEQRWEAVAREVSAAMDGKAALAAGECRSLNKEVRKRLRSQSSSGMKLSRPVADSDDDCVKVFMDIDINGAAAAYARGATFVSTKNLAYNLSSTNITELGGSELSRLPALYASDFEWSSKGRARFRAPRQRIVLEIFKKTAPLAAQNFLSLVTGKGVQGEPLGVGKSGKRLSYVGCPFHRILPRFVLQGGDFVTHTGSGGESIYGKRFKDDAAALKVDCDRVGMLGMCNSGKNSNTSQFFLSLTPSKNLRGKHVFFGRLIQGFDVLASMSVCGSAEGKPNVPVIIQSCGLAVR